MKRLPLALMVSLLLALAHGMTYVWLMPPWQHYDEPNHFEYTWLLANRLRLPEEGEYDPDMRRAVAQSMIAAGFFRGMDALPDLDAPDGQVWIGTYEQLTEPPIYYALTAIPVWLLRGTPITTQLYAARLVSVSLLLVSIWAIHGLASEITHPGSPLRWMLPAGAALLPGYVEMMTSVNNDVGAAAFMALVLWGTVRLVMRGISLWTLLWSGAVAGICLLVKETSYLAFPLWLVGVGLAVMRKGWWRILAWTGLGAAGLLALLLSIGWGDANTWFRRTDQSANDRQVHANAPLGQAVFALQLMDTGQAQGDPVQLTQIVPAETLQTLRGEKVTVGAWIWADTPATLSMPILLAIKADRENEQAYNPVEIGTTPTFYAYIAYVPEDTSILMLNLSSLVTGGSAGGQVYLDGLVLARGEHPLGEAPSWDEAGAETGTWGGVMVVNALRNASAEGAGLRFYPWVDRLGKRILPDNSRPSQFLYSLVDFQVSEGYYRATAKNMLQTFWGKFGWGHVFLEGKYTYWALAVVTVVGLLGCGLFLWRKLNPTRALALLLLGIALASVWGLAVIRGVFYLIYWPFIPGARYAFPVLGATIGVLVFGWWSLVRPIGRRFKLPDGLLIGLMGVGMLALDIWSMLSVWSYYAG